MKTQQQLLADFLKRELPGVDSQVTTSSETDTVQVRLRHLVIAPQATGDLHIALSKMALAEMASQLVRGIRKSSIDALGLAPELARARAEGAADERQRTLRFLQNTLDRSRNDVGNLPEWAIPAKRWLDDALKGLPRIEVPRDLHSEDLTEATKGIWRDGMMGMMSDRVTL